MKLIIDIDVSPEEFKKIQVFNIKMMNSKITHKIYEAVQNGIPVSNITNAQIGDAIQAALAAYWEEKSKHLTPPPTPTQCCDCSNKDYMKEQKLQSEWIKNRNPDKDGAYLCITGIGDMMYFRHILYFTQDLYKKDPCAFYEYRCKRKNKRSGWYDMCEYGYFEIPRVLAWCELPEIPEEFRAGKKEEENGK